eukprot:scaffold999_cov289-Pinguiococcus_pyrenoidosus.AAC.7
MIGSSAQKKTSTPIHIRPVTRAGDEVLKRLVRDGVDKLVSSCFGAVALGRAKKREELRLP